MKIDNYPVKYDKTIQRQHPPSRERFSLKIDVRAHITWNCLLELWLFHSSQMKLKLAGLFFKNPPDGAGGSLKCIKSKN